MRVQILGFLSSSVCIYLNFIEMGLRRLLFDFSKSRIKLNFRADGIKHDIPRFQASCLIPPWHLMLNATVKHDISPWHHGPHVCRKELLVYTPKVVQTMWVAACGSWLGSKHDRSWFRRLESMVTKLLFNIIKFIQLFRVHSNYKMKLP